MLRRSEQSAFWLLLMEGGILLGVIVLGVVIVCTAWTRTGTLVDWKDLKQISYGMAEAEVRAKLGPPDHVGYYYSSPPIRVLRYPKKNQEYRHYYSYHEVVLDRDNRVIGFSFHDVPDESIRGRIHKMEDHLRDCGPQLITVLLVLSAIVHFAHFDKTKNTYAVVIGALEALAAFFLFSFIHNQPR